MNKYIQNIKQKFGIIGYDYILYRALEKTIQIAPTDISVLVLGESGVGKEVIPKIIHQLSCRKHNSYIAVNCGAIPEGTIDSELFGHEKGSFTGATNMRKGYFEVANGGTIFLDEVGELPLTTQVRLLRILESGEFIKVGSSKIQKTNIRIVAATNVDIDISIKERKFREDLYYRLNTVQINIPPLRRRKNDIKFLFKKFSNDFSEKYKTHSVQLTNEAMNYLENYQWPGNIRQLKNLAEQISVVEKNRTISIDKIKEYIPNHISLLSTNSYQDKLKNHNNNEYFFSNFSRERDFIYKIFFDMKKNIDDIKNILYKIIKSTPNIQLNQKTQKLINKVFGKYITHENSSHQENTIFQIENNTPIIYNDDRNNKKSIKNIAQNNDKIEKNIKKNNYINNSIDLSLQKKEIEFIKKVLEKNKGKRKKTAKELGISERTLYRKIKQYKL